MPFDSELESNWYASIGIPVNWRFIIYTLPAKKRQLTGILIGVYALKADLQVRSSWRECLFHASTGILVALSD